MKFGKIFLLVMAVVVLSKPFIPVFFYLSNIEQITAYYCINKDKPMLHCDGKCYLAQKMAEAREKEKSERGPTDFVDHSFLQVDWIESFTIDLNYPIALKNDRDAYVNINYNFNFYTNPFMPPKAV